MILGRVISGKFGEICIRQHSQASLELGTLLVAEPSDTFSSPPTSLTSSSSSPSQSSHSSQHRQSILLQVYDLVYGSQISQQNLELVSGLDLEETGDIRFFDPALRQYTLAYVKNLIHLGGDHTASKSLPSFFSPVRAVQKEDFAFLSAGRDAVFLGNLRSGTPMHASNRSSSCQCCSL